MFAGLLAMLLGSLVASADGASVNDSEGSESVQVHVLGTIHISHLGERWGYTLQDLSNIIRAIRPNLVCAEVYDRDYQTDMNGYYPNFIQLRARIYAINLHIFQWESFGFRTYRRGVRIHAAHA